jgi:AcrR family transcriptional regulator
MHMPHSHATAEPRWRRLPEERPQQILEAATEVFAEKGLAAARLEDIARRAGVSKGTIYLYFPNKEELFREMVRQLVIANIERAERALDDDATSAGDQLRRYIRAHWAFQRSTLFQALLKFLHSELHQHPDLAEFYFREVVMRALRLLAAIIRRGIAAGEFRQVDPDVAARMFAALSASHAVWCARRDVFLQVRDKTDEEIVAELIDFYLGAIQARHAVDAGLRA